MRYALILVLIGCMLVGSSLVQAQSGGDYDLTWNTIDGGGGLSSGGDYSVQGTIGQPDAGAMNGGDYSLQGGFWHAACVPPAAPNPTIGLINNDVQLSWLPVDQADSYNIYRDTSPYFVATAVYDSADAGPWSDPGAAGNPALNYTYLMRAVGCGQSGDSLRIGEFDFALVPGN